MNSTPPSTAASALQAEKQLIQAVSDTFAVNVAAAGATAWLAYDILLTLNQEISLVWPTKLSLPKVLYFGVRYYMLFALIFNIAVNTNTNPPFDLCRNWFWFIGYSGPVAAAFFGEAMFLIRLHAAYGRSRKVLILIVSLWALEAIVSMTTVAIEVSSLEVSPRTAGYPLPGCIASSPKHIKVTLASWIVSLFVSVVYFALIMGQFVFTLGVSLKHEGGILSLFQTRKWAPIIWLFVRDGTFYFFMISAVTAINLFFIVVLADRAIEQMGTAWMMAAYAVASSRLYLNLRGCSVRSTAITTRTDEIELSNRATLGEMFAARRGTTGSTFDFDGEDTLGTF